MTKIALHPIHPERVCWGCDKYCAADDLRCGNGTVRTLHPCELFGDDWLEWSVLKLTAEVRGNTGSSTAGESPAARPSIPKTTPQEELL